MNAKKAKQLRKLANGNTASYNELGKPPIYEYLYGSYIKTAKGTSRTLDPQCSRYIYQQMKKTSYV